MARGSYECLCSNIQVFVEDEIHATGKITKAQYDKKFDIARKKCGFPDYDSVNGVRSRKKSKRRSR